MYVDNLLEQEMFAPSSLGWDIAGTDETVNGLTRDDMMFYIKEYYEPGNVVVGISGNFEEDAAKALLVNHFDRAWESQAEIKPYVAHAFPAEMSPRVIIQKKDTEQVQLALGFPAYHYLHADAPALGLLGVILGGNMSSRLFINVRERLGLCYYIKSSNQPYQDVGNFYVQAGLAKDRIDEAVTVILQELATMVEQGVTEEELGNAKEYMKGKMALQLEDSESVVSWYVTQEVMTKETLTPEEKLAKFNAVTSADISRVAKDIFQVRRSTLAIIGPFEDKERFVVLLK